MVPMTQTILKEDPLLNQNKMITCCEIALVLGITNVISLAIFAGYNMKLDRRTITLEKKNGHEQHQINQLTTQVKELEQKLKTYETSNQN